MLNSIETVRSREFFAGMFFRFAFGIILILELLALLFVDQTAQADGGNLVAERLDTLSVATFLISTFLASYWYVFLALSRERVRSLQMAIKSSAEMEKDFFEFFEISRRYSYEVGVGRSFVLLARMEPMIWWALITMVGIVVLVRLGIVL